MQFPVRHINDQQELYLDYMIQVQHFWGRVTMCFSLLGSRIYMI